MYLPQIFFLLLDKETIPNEKVENAKTIQNKEIDTHAYVSALKTEWRQKQKGLKGIVGCLNR